MVDSGLFSDNGVSEVLGLSRMTADRCRVDGQPFQGYGRPKLS
jgi:hypothetical protein